MKNSPRFTETTLNHHIAQDIAHALSEDLGDGDITAQLIDVDDVETARIITREDMVLAGRPWVEKLFAILDPTVEIQWNAKDGDRLNPNDEILRMTGNSRSMLSGERIALNFIQTMSGVATIVAEHVAELDGLHTKLLDTRKTIPGLRIAQKYAVIQGGGNNHRVGLYDMFLIKENHIMAQGSITGAVQQARKIAPERPVEVEVENMTQLDEALAAGTDIVMLDNFTTEEMAAAVTHVAGRCKLEASGDITKANLREVAETGVDFISMGALTKHVRAIDLSMRVIQ